MEPSQTEFQHIPDAAAPEHALPQARFFTPGVAVWALLACLAAGYLALVAIKPDALAGYLPSLSPSGSPEDNEGQRATAANELQAVRDGLSQVQLDVAKIKTDLAARDDREKAVETRLSVLEDIKRGAIVATTTANPPATAASAAGVPLTAVAPATPAATAAAKAAAKKAAAAAAKAVAPVAAPAAAIVPAVPVAPAPVAKPAANAAAAIAPPIAVPDPVAAQGVKLINSPLSQSSAASKAAPAAVAPAVAPANAAEAIAPKLETGSLQNLGAASAAKPLGVYIASGPSVDSLRQSWSALAGKNADALGTLEPRYTTGIDANGLNYGLVAGPVRSAADAQKLCRDLAARAVACRVGDFTGEAL